MGRLKADQELPPGSEGLIYMAVPRGDLGLQASRATHPEPPASPPAWPCVTPFPPPLQYVGSFLRRGHEGGPREAFANVLYRARRATEGPLARAAAAHPTMASWDVRVLERIVDLRHPVEIDEAKLRWLLDLEPTLNGGRGARREDAEPGVPGVLGPSASS